MASTKPAAKVEPKSPAIIAKIYKDGTVEATVLDLSISGKSMRRADRSIYLAVRNARLKAHRKAHPKVETEEERKEKARAARADERRKENAAKQLEADEAALKNNEENKPTT